MDMLLPYKVGDFAEAKSLVEGFRGAWFRCRVIGMRVTDSGDFECHLEWSDYEGEDNEWVMLFQEDPAFPKRKAEELIMIRPSFPQWYRKDQVPEQFPNNDIIVTVHETWKVGDLVDWLSEGCYWSGKITKLFNNKNMVEVQLPEPPVGEGKRYRANRNDLRPTLEWSLIKGWTVPRSQAKGKSWYAARLSPHKPEPGKRASDEKTAPDDEEDDATGGAKDMQQPGSITPNMSQEASESDMSDSSEETSPDDDNSSDGQGADGDAVQQSISIFSIVSQEVRGSPIREPSSAHNISGLKAQKAATEPGSTSKSPDHAAQAAGTSSQPGKGSSIKQAPGIMQEQVDSAPDKFLVQLEEVKGKLNQLLELSQPEQLCRKAVSSS